MKDTLYDRYYRIRIHQLWLQGLQYLIRLFKWMPVWLLLSICVQYVYHIQITHQLMEIDSAESRKVLEALRSNSLPK